MRRDDVRFAAAARDDGLRKISKLTWRAGAAGVVCSAVIAVAFGHHVAAPQPATVHGGTSSAGSSNSGGGASGSKGTIVVPAQPPAPAKGGGQVTSGGT
jgi:hypothetical protein